MICSAIDCTVDTVKSIAEQIIKFFLRKYQFSRSSRAKTALKTIPKSVFILINNKLKKRNKIKNLLKKTTKVALKTCEK